MKIQSTPPMLAVAARAKDLTQIAREYLTSTTFQKLDKLEVPASEYGRLPKWMQKDIRDIQKEDRLGVTAHELHMGGQTVYGLTLDEGNVVQISVYTAAGKYLAAGYAAGENYSTQPLKLIQAG